MRILFLDIETAPHTAMVWGLFKQNINLSWLLESGYTLCWAAKWLGHKKVMFGSVYKSGGPVPMLQEVHDLLSEADCVVHYFGSNFDVPTLNKEFLLHGILPPAPYIQLDLFRIVSKMFKFPSKKLQYVSKILGLEGKFLHRGPEMWKGCIKGDIKAWREMEKYNKQDVVVLEDVYKKLLPWINTHPHIGLFENRPTACANCGHHALESRGHAYTKTSKYRRFRCLNCATWMRSTKRESGVTTQPIT